jgi:hypothetical protein
MADLSLPAVPPIRCPAPGCGWEQRHVELSAADCGIFAISHRCENGHCRQWMVVLYRVSMGRELAARILGVKPRLGRDETSYRASLRQFPELQTDDGADRIEFMVAVASLFGWLQSAPSRPAIEPTHRRRLRPGARPTPK